jgi:hypothetical protein
MAVDATGWKGPLATVAGAIRQASRATGASFDYLLATAKVESNLNPSVSAGTSSATGLFQFIEQTWLATLKRAGPTLGYGRYADAVVETRSGGYAVPDPAMRAAVLNLRRDPAANAAMAGAFTQRNGAELREQLRRAPTGGELYIAHFLGAAGAAKLITHAARSPAAAAADLFPGAAAANRSIFYDRGGRARSVADVYGVLVGRFETARMATLARGGEAPSDANARSGNASGSAADPAGAFDALAMVSAVPVAKAGDAGGAFHSLFQTGGARQPISPVLRAIWGDNGGSSMPGISERQT